MLQSLEDLHRAGQHHLHQWVAWVGLRWEIQWAEWVGLRWVVVQWDPAQEHQCLHQ